MLFLAIFVGGAAGAAARYLLAAALLDRTGPAFPWGTLGVNVAGSLALGIVLPLLMAEVPLTEANTPSLAVRGLVTAGFLSSFTTFSAFAWETAAMLRAGRRGHAAAYVAASLCGGLAALLLGLVLADRLF